MPSRWLARFRCLFLAVAAALVSPLAAAQPWPYASDIVVDARVVYGELPNGFRYALLPNRRPADAVSFRLAFEFGSLDEKDDQRGLAHFIEHMAFNGSRHVPEGEVIPRLQALGLSIGSDANASTDQHNTVYRFDLPRADTEAIGESLFLLHEIAAELSIDPGALDREREVVLAELRSHDTFAERLNAERLEFLMPGAYAVSRPPLGRMETVAAASAPDLRALYDQFYRPERAILVVAGDFDAGTMQQRVAETFSGWKGRGPAGVSPAPSYSLPKRDAAASISVHETGGDRVMLYRMRPIANHADTAAWRREQQLIGIGTAIVDRRLTRLANAPNPPFRAATLSYGSFRPSADAAVAAASVLPGAWAPAVGALDQEWRRALEFGFSQQEVDEQISILQASRQNTAARESGRTSSELASLLLATALDKVVFETPGSALARWQTDVREITPESVLKAFRTYMAQGEPLLILSSTLDVSEKDVLQAWRTSSVKPVEAPPVSEKQPFAYTWFGSPGRVRQDRPQSDVGARLLVFDNNVRLNIKRTAFQPNSVLVSVRIAGGEVAFAGAPAGLGLLMKAQALGGLEQHSLDDLRSILAGRAVQASFSMGASAFGGSYATTPADLELQLQLTAAFLMHPGYRPEGERMWREALLAAIPQWTADAPSVLATEGLRLLGSGDLRVGADPGDRIVDRTYAELQAFVEPMLRENAIEITIVGDIDEEAAIAAVARTFGALPPRRPEWSPYRAATSPVFRADRSPLVLHHTGEKEQAVAALFWPIGIDPDTQPQDVRLLATAGSILESKINHSLREQQGISYAPSAAGMLSSIYPGWGYLLLGAEVRPADTEKAMAALRLAAADLREGRVTKEDIALALAPAIDQLPAHATMNSYWLSLLSEIQFRPDRANQVKLQAVEAGYRAITVADVVSAAKRWFDEKAAQEVRVLPR